MSWLARSFNSLIPAAGDVTGDGDDHIADEVATTPHQTLADRTQGSDPHQLDPESPTRGVKDDLSELTKTLSRQFWGVASFLAPPPSAVTTDPPPEAAETPGIAGIRSDFAEIGGRFRSGISKLSSNKAVTEISKIASSFLPFGDEEGEEEEEQQGGDGEGGAIGVTDEVLAFARNVAMHPETWLDFPLFVDDDESDEFDLSDTQQEHALAVEHLEPRLAALRIELCPSHMSEGCFWKIYFVLLHSRLNKHDAELLSTPQIVEARARWLQELQYRTKPKSVRPREGLSFRKESFGSSSTEELVTIPFNESPVSHEFGKSTCVPTTDFETDKHPVQITEVKVVDKSVIEEELQAQEKNEDIISSASEISVQKYEEDMDDWLEEETGEMGTSGGTTIPIVNEDDVSFSDLEEDDEQTLSLRP